MLRWLRRILGSEDASKGSGGVYAQDRSVSTGGSIINSDISIGLDEIHLADTLDRRELNTHIISINARIQQLKMSLNQPIDTDSAPFQGMSVLEAENLKQSMLGIRNSADYWDWSVFHTKLGLVLLQYSERSDREIIYVSQSLEAFRQSIKYGKGYCDAENWMIAHINIGYISVIRLEPVEDRLYEGIKSLRAALEVLEKNSDHQKIAMADFTITIAYEKLYDLVEISPDFKNDVIDAYVRARNSFGRVGDTKQLQFIDSRLAQLTEK